MRTRYTFDANSGLLVDRNGNTLGRVVGITVDDVPLATTARLGYGATTSSDLPEEERQKEEAVVKGRGVGKPEKPTPAQLEREAVQRVWEFWLEASGKRHRLDSKRERIIRNALKLVGEEAVKTALLGLTRSPHHQGHNEQRKPYMEVRYALKGIGDESDDERIEKAITWAALYAPNTMQLPEARVQRYLEDVRYTLSLPHRPERDRATRAWKALTTAGFRVIPLNAPPWARLER